MPDGVIITETYFKMIALDLEIVFNAVYPIAITPLGRCQNCIQLTHSLNGICRPICSSDNLRSLLQKLSLTAGLRDLLIECSRHPVYRLAEIRAG